MCTGPFCEIQRLLKVVHLMVVKCSLRCRMEANCVGFALVDVRGLEGVRCVCRHYALMMMMMIYTCGRSLTQVGHVVGVRIVTSQGWLLTRRPSQQCLFIYRVGCRCQSYKSGLEHREHNDDYDVGVACVLQSMADRRASVLLWPVVSRRWSGGRADGQVAGGAARTVQTAIISRARR